MKEKKSIIPFSVIALSIALALYIIQLFDISKPIRYAICIIGIAITVYNIILQQRLSAGYIKLVDSADCGKRHRLYSVNDVLNTFAKIESKTIRSYYSATSIALSRKQAELNALQSQINPHFLYNTLDAIRGNALLAGVTEIADMTEALSLLFRYSISREGNLVTLKDELHNSERYIKLQQYRFCQKFQIEYNIDDNATICYLPRLTIQPIVENAIYHGLEGKKRGGKLTFRVFTTNRTLTIHVIDDGVSMPQSKIDELNQKLLDPPTSVECSSGIALSNVHSRIRLLFGSTYGIYISGTEGIGTDVQITLPLISDANIAAQYKEVLFDD